MVVPRRSGATESPSYHSRNAPSPVTCQVPGSGQKGPHIETPMHHNNPKLLAARCLDGVIPKDFRTPSWEAQPTLENMQLLATGSL